MKLLVSAIVLGLGAITFAPQAEAQICAHGAHRAHCSAHKRIAHGHYYHYVRRYSERAAWVLEPPLPYVYYYPPMPAAIFDLPPERGFPDQPQ